MKIIPLLRFWSVVVLVITLVTLTVMLGACEYPGIPHPMAGEGTSPTPSSTPAPTPTPTQTPTPTPTPTLTPTQTPTPTPTPTLTPPPPYAGLENPFPWDDTSVQEAGKVIFQGSCAVCHVATEQVPALGIDFYAVDYRQSLEERPDFYFWVVSEGRLDTLMPPWGAVFSEEERWQALTYIWSLGGVAPTRTPTPSPTPALTPSAPSPPMLDTDEKGRALFISTACRLSHDSGDD